MKKRRRHEKSTIDSVGFLATFKMDCHKSSKVRVYILVIQCNIDIYKVFHSDTCVKLKCSTDVTYKRDENIVAQSVVVAAPGRGRCRTSGLRLLQRVPGAPPRRRRRRPGEVVVPAGDRAGRTDRATRRHRVVILVNVPCRLRLTDVPGRGPRQNLVDPPSVLVRTVATLFTVPVAMTILTSGCPCPIGAVLWLLTIEIL